MMSLFRPKYLGCVVCNAAPSRYSAYATTAHKKLGEGIYEGYGCGHRFTLFDSLAKASAGGVYGIVGTYAHWSWDKEHDVVLGQLEKIAPPIPPHIRILTAFLTGQGGGDPQSVFGVPQVVTIGDTEILISTTAFLGAPTEHLGKRVRLNVSVYGVDKSETRGWTKLLYESLADLAERRYAIATFKLATSVEIACERAIERYVRQCGVPEGLTDKLMSGGKNWHARMARMREIAKSILQPQEFSIFLTAADQFLTQVRVLRNAFAHDQLQDLGSDDVKEAHRICFPILWCVDKVELETAALGAT